MSYDQHTLKRKYSPAGSGESIFQKLKNIGKDFPKAHALGFRLASRNVKARYRLSILGPLWAFLPPLGTAFIWIILRNQGVVDMGEIPVSYPVFVIIGTTLWQSLMTAVNVTMNTVNTNKSLFTKINFPREAVIITAFYETLVNVAVGIIIILAVLFISGIGIQMSCLAVVPGVLVMIFLGMTVTLLLLPFSLLFQDIQKILPMVFQFLMYLTPVVYPKPAVSSIGWLFKYNPLGHLINFIRNNLVGIAGDVSVFHFTVLAIGVMLLFISGVIIYRVTMEVLIERMGS